MCKPILSLLLMLLLSSYLAFGQQISKQESDSLYRSLANAKRDTGMVSTLLKLSTNQMYSRGAGGTKWIDSAYGFIRQAADLSYQLHSERYQHKVQLYLARYYFVTGAFNKGHNTLMGLIQYYHKIGDIYQEATAWKELGDDVSFDDAHRSEIRLNGYQQAYELFKKGNYRLEAIQEYKNMADAHLNQGKLDLAEKELLQVIDDYRKIGFKALQYTYDLLAVVYHKKGDRVKELKYGLLAIESMGQTSVVSQRLALIIRVARVYQNMGLFEKSLEWANKALVLCRNYNHDDIYYIIICTVANANISNGRYPEAFALLSAAQQEEHKSPTLTQYINLTFGDYYMALQLYNKAEPFYLKAFNFFGEDAARRNANNNYNRARVALANIDIHQGKFGQARKYLELTEGQPPEKDPVHIGKQELALFKVDSAERHLASAITHFQKYKQINDSLYNITKKSQIAQIEVQYETKEKEQAIEILNGEKLSQNERLDKVNLERNIILGALVLSAILGFIGYRFYRYKQRTNEEVLKSHKLIESKNKQLEFLVEEKEWLLKEVHHRVKNNLHTIICLLESQAAYLDNDALKAIEKSQNRIYTMSLIHQKLYQSDDIQTIDMASYIPELVQNLKDSFDISDRIYYRVTIDQISLGPAIAVPVALIINEAVTNSIKYAFPGDRRGEIIISLQEEGAFLTLKLTDNGIGMKNNLETVKPVSLGLELIRGLTKEIGGDVHIESDRGFKIVIIFKKHALSYDGLYTA